MHLYLHVPFCARRCSYCDFAIAVRRDVPSDRYVDAVLTEWRGWQQHPSWADAPALETIYFGGGTPSLLGTSALRRLMNGLAELRTISDGAEITLEANPDDIAAEHVDAWRAAGINRVSLGAQSFDQNVLSWMHRTHAADAPARAVATLRAHGIGNISLDLIFGAPASLQRDWARDLDAAFALAPDHLSLYGLTIEPGTALARWTARGDVRPIDEHRYADEFLMAHERLEAEGYEHYEVSNAGRPGRRAVHNSSYWRRAPYIGLGPSAHSGFADRRRWNVRDWAAYERATAKGEPVLEGEEELDAVSGRLERLYLGLRTDIGVPESQIPVADADRWVAAGWAVRAAGQLRLTAEGWLRLDAIVASVA